MIPNPYDGIFIAFGGADGCGKSYYLDLIAKELRSQRNKVFITKEPNKNGFWGKKIYGDLYKENGIHVTNPVGFQKWYACDSKENLKKNIIPALKNNYIVLADRFRMACCYGVTTGINTEQRAIKEELLRLIQINESILQEYFIWPDLYIVFDASPATCIERLKKKGRKLDGHENEIKIEIVRRNYLLFTEFFPHNCCVVDNERDPGVVFADIQNLVLTVIARKRS